VEGKLRVQSECKVEPVTKVFTIYKYVFIYERPYKIVIKHLNHSVKLEDITDEYLDLATRSET
jgi:hypothetical protein